VTGRLRWRRPARRPHGSTSPAVGLTVAGCRVPTVASDRWGRLARAISGRRPDLRPWPSVFVTRTVPADPHGAEAVPSSWAPRARNRRPRVATAGALPSSLGVVIMSSSCPDPPSPCGGGRRPSLHGPAVFCFRHHIRPPSSAGHRAPMPWAQVCCPRVVAAGTYTPCVTYYDPLVSRHLALRRRRLSVRASHHRERVREWLRTVWWRPTPLSIQVWTPAGACLP
jgi:hypothetical protein